ncbi:hypothetical protein PPACK8108_LOCUS17139 [Phakopsora pachyrhizi]|uniref:Uncharacterized protein n=1 Tax=Phakopsora pachyrhizi TaxID=170000 RepID=A0AAV0BC12_PHAPC|nr:hypothetical protein PPACK8108_LOCUS17139 [Phakopsora pachyrhizi]
MLKHSSSLGGKNRASTSSVEMWRVGLSGLLTGHREINEEAQKNQLLWIEVMEK